MVNVNMSRKCQLFEKLFICLIAVIVYSDYMLVMTGSTVTYRWLGSSTLTPQYKLHTFYHSYLYNCYIATINTDQENKKQISHPCMTSSTCTVSMYIVKQLKRRTCVISIKCIYKPQRRVCHLRKILSNNVKIHFGISLIAHINLSLWKSLKESDHPFI